MLKADYPISSGSKLQESKPLSPTDVETKSSPGSDTVDVPRNFGEVIFAILRPLAPLLLVAAVILLVAVLFLAEKRGEVPTIESEEVFVADEPRVEKGFGYRASDFTKEGALKESLIEERGGRAHLAGFKSQRYSGTLGDDGGRDFYLLTMTPNLGLLQVTGAGEQYSLGFDGTDYWKVVRTDGGGRRGVLPSSAEVSLLHSVGGVHGPLLDEFLNANPRIVSVEDREELSGPVIRVRYVGRFGEKAQEVDLDPRDLALLRWQSEDEAGNVSVVRYQDYQEIRGREHPSRIELWRNGVRKFELRIDSAVPNFGAVRLLFENPTVSD